MSTVVSPEMFMLSSAPAFQGGAASEFERFVHHCEEVAVGHARLRHRVAFADREGSVGDGLRVYGDAPRRAGLVLAAVALSDSSGDIVVGDEILFEDKKPEPEESEDDPDDPDKEGDGDDDGDEEEKEKKPFKLEGHLYSTRLMGQAILNRLGIEDSAAVIPQTAAEAPESAEEGLIGALPAQGEMPTEGDANGEDVIPSERVVPVEDAKPTGDEIPVVNAVSDTGAQPVIGMDGKTEDGAMPYELLRKQLDFLK